MLEDRGKSYLFLQGRTALHFPSLVSQLTRFHDT